MFLYLSRSRHFQHYSIDVRGGVTVRRSTVPTEADGKTLGPFRDRLGVQPFLVLVAGLLIELSSCQTGLAQPTFSVDSQTDAIDNDINDGICATIAGTCTLRAAIQQVNALGSGVTRTINVPAGTYQLNIVGQGEENAATGDLDIKAKVIIKGAGVGATFIDANDIDRVLVDRINHFDLRRCRAHFEKTV